MLAIGYTNDVVIHYKNQKQKLIHKCVRYFTTKTFDSILECNKNEVLDYIKNNRDTNYGRPLNKLMRLENKVFKFVDSNNILFKR